MKRILRFDLVFALAWLALVIVQSNCHAQGTAFTYQGQLASGGAVANGTYNFQFTLYNNTAGSGSPQAGPVTTNGVLVTNGLFTVTMDFGSGPWNGQSNWLQIAVETNHGATFTTLTPLQEVTPVPYSIYAESAGAASASGLTSIGNNSGGSGNFFVGPSGNAVTSGSGNTAIGNGAFLVTASGSYNTADGYGTLFSDASGSNDTANGAFALDVNSSGSGNVADGTSALFYNISGNDNTAIGDDALVDLAFHAATQGGTNNIGLGYQAGSAFAGNESSNIDIGNTGVEGESGVIRIGSSQAQTFIAGVINGNGGGLTNFNVSQLPSAVLTNNEILSVTLSNLTLSGSLNLPNNIDEALGYQAMNYISSYPVFQSEGIEAGYSTAVGYQALYYNGYSASQLLGQSEAMDNTALGYQALNYNSYIGSNADVNGFSASGNTAIGYQALYYNNYLGSGGNVDGTVVANNNTAVGMQALYNNCYNPALITLNESGGAVNAHDNTAIGYAALYNNGSDLFFLNFNDASGTINAYGNIAIGSYAGYNLVAGANNIDIGNEGVEGDNGIARIGNPTYVTDTFLAGNIHGSGSFAAGQQAQATNQADFVWADSQGVQFGSTSNNQFLIRAQGGVGIDTNSPQQAFSINGGLGVDQGDINAGYLNGGHGSSGWGLSFGNNSGEGIASQRTSGTSQYSLDFYTEFAQRMIILQNGNVGIDNSDPGHLLAVGSAAYCDGNAWYPSSDKNRKAGFEPLNTTSVLAKVAALPITRWHYTNDVNTPHMGPMAQDFYAAFKIGPDDKHIAEIDESGVALAAIQGLNEKLEGRSQNEDAKMQKLEDENADLKKQNDLLVQRLNELEQTVKALVERN